MGGDSASLPSAESPGPAPRSSDQMLVYDAAFTPSQSSLAPARDGLLLYEASNPSGTSGVTWRWDGKTWRELSRGGGPSPRQGSHMVAFDRARQRHVLFGGVQLLNGGRERRRLGDLWEWDGRRWSRARPPPA